MAEIDAVEENQSALLYLIAWMTGDFSSQLKAVQDEQASLALTQQLIREEIAEVRNSISAGDEINKLSERVGAQKQSLRNTVDEIPAPTGE